MYVVKLIIIFPSMLYIVQGHAVARLSEERSQLVSKKKTATFSVFFRETVYFFPPNLGSNLRAGLIEVQARLQVAGV